MIKKTTKDRFKEWRGKWCTIATNRNFSNTSNKTSDLISEDFGLQVPFQIQNWTDKDKFTL